MISSDVIHDFKCGRHSGVPTCCIFWFVCVWVPMFRFKKIRVWYFNRILNWDYIPCLLCVITKKNVGKLKVCSCLEENHED